MKALGAIPRNPNAKQAGQHLCCSNASLLGPHGSIGELAEWPARRRRILPEVPVDPIDPRRRGSLESPYDLSLEVQDLDVDPGWRIRAGVVGVRSVVGWVNAVGLGLASPDPVRQEHPWGPLLAS